MKDQLIFDTTSAATILDSDSVGAFVRASDGTLITHTTNGAKEGLDVNLINDSIAVTATDLDIRDLTQSDEITVFQGTDPWIIGDGGGSITVDGTVAATQSGTWDVGTLTSITNDVNIADGGNSITVDAIDLDIRDLSAASDSVQSNLFDGAGNALTSTLVGSDQALDVNVVGGVNVEVDLSHVDDSVALGDGTNLLTSTTIGSDIGLDVNVINNPSIANVSIATSANSLSVADTSEDIIASPLSNRKFLAIYNDGNRKIFIGPNGVSAANGFPISPGSSIELLAGSAIDIEYVGQSGASGAAAAIRTLELS